MKKVKTLICDTVKVSVKYGIRVGINTSRLPNSFSKNPALLRKNTGSVFKKSIMYFSLTWDLFL